MVVVVVEVVVVDDGSVACGVMKPGGCCCGGGGQLTPTDALATLFSLFGSGVSAVTAASSFVIVPHVVVALDVTVTENVPSESRLPMSQRKRLCAASLAGLERARRRAFADVLGSVGDRPRHACGQRVGELDAARRVGTVVRHGEIERDRAALTRPTPGSRPS